MSSPNIPLLRKYVEWVEEQENLPREDPRREWNQGDWISFWDEWEGTFFSDPDELTEELEEVNEHSCRTAYCVAGRVAIDAGYALAPGGTIKHAPPGQERFIGHGVSEVARRILGLSLSEASQLFDAINGADEIRAYAEEFAEKAGEKLF